MWCWIRKKISWTDRVRNGVLQTSRGGEKCPTNNNKQQTTTNNKQQQQK
jgi:hypothetical protein